MGYNINSALKQWMLILQGVSLQRQKNFRMDKAVYVTLMIKKVKALFGDQKVNVLIYINDLYS